MKDIIEKINKRIFIFIAYKDYGDGATPFYSRLFNDHTELKEFSAKHSESWKIMTKGYHSTYLDLTNKDFISSHFTDNRVLEEEKKIDLEFLKEMYENLARAREDVVSFEHLTTMIKDWTNELEQSLLGDKNNK